MEIRVLKYFLAVVREESITKAAEVLHITQPTLSRQLAQLEEEVGVKLFDRGTRKIVLTDARKGYGYAIVVEGSLPFRDGAGVAFRPLAPSLTTSVAFAWKREQPMNMPMKKFIEHAKYFLGMNEP